MNDSQSKKELEDYLDIDGWKKVETKVQEMQKKNATDCTMVTCEYDSICRRFSDIERQLKSTLPSSYQFETSKQHSCSIIYPVDVLVGKNLNSVSKVKALNEIDNDDLILDIGPKTIDTIKKVIENSETVLWNGPAGYFENPNFANGSYEIAKAIIKKNKKKSIYSVVGGGDTIALINGIKAIRDFNFVSTAGGAFLEYLEGKDLPGIKALS